MHYGSNLGPCIDQEDLCSFATAWYVHGTLHCQGIVYVERKKQVSASDNGMSPETPNALVTYAAQRQHWCVFARAHATLLAN